MDRVVRLAFVGVWLVSQIATAQVTLNWPVQTEMHFIANPALSSVEGKLTVGLANGRRWQKMKSSPSLSNIFCILPLRNEKMTTAFHLFSDKVGPLSGTGMDLAYSYHFQTSRKSSDRLSLGLSLRLMQFRFDHGHLVASDYDPIIGLVPSKGIVPPSINIGVSYQTEDPSYGEPVQMVLALSARKQLFYRERFSPNQLNQLTWYGMVGLRIRSTEFITVEPGVLIQHGGLEARDYSFRMKISHERHGWFTAQFAKTGVLSTEVGLNIGKVSFGETWRVSAGNSWFLGNASTQLGNSIFFGLSCQF